MMPSAMFLQDKIDIAYSYSRKALFARPQHSCITISCSPPYGRSQCCTG